MLRSLNAGMAVRNVVCKSELILAQSFTFIQEFRGTLRNGMMAYAADIAAQALVVSLDAELAPIPEVRKKFALKKKKKRCVIWDFLDNTPTFNCDRNSKQVDQAQLVTTKTQEAKTTAPNESAPLVRTTSENTRPRLTFISVEHSSATKRSI